MSGAGGIVALAGRRPDPVGATSERFPLENAGSVEARLRERFREWKTDVLICSAAAGSDLLALRAARDIGLRRLIVLPFSPKRFRESSVVDRPGGWGELYDVMIADAAAADDLIVLELEEDGRAYERVNEVILERAKELAGAAGGEEKSAPGENGTAVRAVIVWEGKPRPGHDLTAAFARLAEEKGIPVTPIVTTGMEED